MKLCSQSRESVKTVVFDKSVFCGWIGPLAAGNLKRVKAKTDVRAVDKLDNLPSIAQGRAVGSPAPIFIG